MDREKEGARKRDQGGINEGQRAIMLGSLFTAPWHGYHGGDVKVG